MEFSLPIVMIPWVCSFLRHQCQHVEIGWQRLSHWSTACEIPASLLTPPLCPRLSTSGIQIARKSAAMSVFNSWKRLGWTSTATRCIHLCCSDDYEKHTITAFTLPYDSCMLFSYFLFVLHLCSSLLRFSTVEFVLQSTVIHWLSITISISGSIILGFELFRLWQPQSRGSSRLFNVLFFV